MNEQQKFTLEDLNQFHGSDQLIRHHLHRDMRFTVGVGQMIVHFGAMWLVNEIAIAQIALARLKQEEFQVWELEVVGSSANLRCDDGNDLLLFEKAIEYTDFPKPGIKLYYTDNVIMLPNEY
jgi:hypothetical protein